MHVDHIVADTVRNIHYDWDNSRDPILEVESGDVVQFECRDVTDGRLGPESTAADAVTAIDELQGHPMTGPVSIAGATPGDVLEVELLDFQHKGIGFTFQLGDGGGILPASEMPEPSLHIWELTEDVGHFVDGIEVPLDPFPGVIGVAPAEAGPHDTMPPRTVGGNMDVKQLSANTILLLPVDAADALFSIGDCHAAQGDGEVCGTGIEAAMSITIQFRLQSDLRLSHPQLKTTGPFTATGRDQLTHGTTGTGDTVLEAAREAVRGMIYHLTSERGLSSAEAYMLCSVVVDLKISEVVNGTHCVSAYLPESIFPA
jgi:acetamidase/formamidase